jgi:hypothetical protein
MKNLTVFFASFLMATISYGQDIISLGDTNTYTPWLGGDDALSVASLSPDKIVMAYKEGGVWEGNLRMGYIKNDTIIDFGNIRKFSYEMTLGRMAVNKLSPSTFLLTYTTNYSFESLFGEYITSDFMIVNNSKTLINDNVMWFSQIGLPNNRFLIAYIDPFTDKGKCAMGYINQSQPVIDSTYTFANTSLPNECFITIDTLSSHNFIITYTDGYSGKSAMGSIDISNKVSFTSLADFSSKEVVFPSVEALGNNRFAITYSSSDYSKTGQVIIGIVGENNQVSYSDKYIFNNVETRFPTSLRLQGDKFLISYHSEGKNYLTVATIQDNTIEFSNSIKASGQAPSNYYIPFTQIKDNEFAFSCLSGVDYSGSIRIGKLGEFLPTSSSEHRSEKDYSVFPNPVNEHLHIQAKGESDLTSIEITDINGKVLLREKYNSDNACIDFSNIQPGVYIISGYSLKGMVFKDIVVK